MNWFSMVAKELAIALGDKATRLLLVGSVVIYAFFYPYPYKLEVQTEIPVAVVDLDHSSLSRQLIRMVAAGSEVIITKRPSSFDKARDACAMGDVQGILLIPQGFQAKVLSSKEAEVSIFSDATCFFTYRQVATDLLKTVKTLSAGIEIKRYRASGADETRALAMANPMPLSVVQLFNQAGGYGTYVVPLVFALILQQTLVMGVGMVAGGRREMGDAAWFSAKPGFGAAALSVLAKLAAYLVLYSIHALLYFGVLHRLYGVLERGHVAEMILVMLLFLSAVILMALVVAAFFKTKESSLFVLLFTSMPVIFLSGISWPIEAIPAWVRLPSFLLPSTTGIDAFVRVSIMGASVWDLGFQVAVLTGLCVGYFLLALYLFRWPPAGRFFGKKAPQKTF